MKLPGKAWLEFEIRREGPSNRLSVVAYYDTTSPPGHLYWYIVIPFHRYIFDNLIRQIERRSGSLPPPAEVLEPLQRHGR